MPKNLAGENKTFLDESPFILHSREFYQIIFPEKWAAHNKKITKYKKQVPIKAELVKEKHKSFIFTQWNYLKRELSGQTKYRNNYTYDI